MRYDIRHKPYDILAAQLWYNIRSHHTRSVYHPRSGYHTVRYIIRDRRERISLKKAWFANKSSFFLVRSTGLEPVRLPTRPSNVRVCLFRQDRVTTLLLYPPWVKMSIPDKKFFSVLYYMLLYCTVSRRVLCAWGYGHMQAAICSSFGFII